MLFRGSKTFVNAYHEDNDRMPLQPKGGNTHHALFCRSSFIFVVLISIFLWCSCSSSTTETATAADVSNNTANAAEEKSKVESVVDNPEKNDALMHAAAEGKAERVRALIAEGANVNAKDSNGFSVLEVAVAFTQDEIVGILIEAGADVNIVSDRGRTPIFAFAMGDVEDPDHEKAVLPIVKRLIAAKADVNYKAPNNITVLEVAAALGYSTVMEALLAAGADVNAKDAREYSALHVAASEHKLKALEVLVKAGADVNATANHNDAYTALFLAASAPQGLADACKPVEGIEGAYDCSMAHDLLADFSDGLKLLLDAGADPNLVGTNGITPLMMAADAGYLEGVKALLKAGADAKALNIHHNTALHYATNCKADEAICVSIAKLIMDNGGDIHVQDADGDTALILAAVRQRKLLVKLFLDAGADPKVKNKEGKSAESFM